MGQKVHPIGFRIGVIRDPDSRWYVHKKQYPALLENDFKIRKFISDKIGKGVISRVDIERAANKVRVTLLTARPGAIIGKGGKGIDDLTMELQKIVSKQDPTARIHVNVSEIRQPDLDAQLVAENIAIQIEKRIAPRRAMRSAISRALRMNCRGIKVIVSGRLGGAEIARSEQEKLGKVPLHTLRADIDYGFAQAYTTYGVIGVKVWIYRGEVLPEKEQMIEVATTKTRRKKAEAVESAPVGETVPVGSNVASGVSEEQPEIAEATAVTFKEEVDENVDA